MRFNEFTHWFIQIIGQLKLPVPIKTPQPSLVIDSNIRYMIFSLTFAGTAVGSENSIATSAPARVDAFNSLASALASGEASIRTTAVCPRLSSTDSTSRPIWPYPTIATFMLLIIKTEWSACKRRTLPHRGGEGPTRESPDYVVRYFAEQRIAAAVFTMSLTVHPRDRSLTGFAKPWRNGPYASAPARRWTSL